MKQDACKEIHSLLNEFLYVFSQETPASETDLPKGQEFCSYLLACFLGISKHSANGKLKYKLGQFLSGKGAPETMQTYLMDGEGRIEREDLRFQEFARDLWEGLPPLGLDEETHYLKFTKLCYHLFCISVHRHSHPFTTITKSLSALLKELKDLGFVADERIKDFASSMSAKRLEKLEDHAVQTLVDALSSDLFLRLVTRHKGELASTIREKTDFAKMVLAYVCLAEDKETLLAVKRLMGHEAFEKLCEEALFTSVPGTDMAFLEPVTASLLLRVSELPSLISLLPSMSVRKAGGENRSMENLGGGTVPEERLKAWSTDPWLTEPWPWSPGQTRFAQKLREKFKSLSSGSRAPAPRRAAKDDVVEYKRDDEEEEQKIGFA